MTENKGVLLMFYKAKYGTLWDKLIALLDGSEYSHVEIVEGWENSTYLEDWLGRVPYIQTIGCRADTGQVSVSRYSEFHSLDFILLPSWEASIEPHTLRKYSFSKLIRTKLHWWKFHPRNTDVCSTWVPRVLGIKNPDNYGVKDLHKYVSELGLRIYPKA